MFNEQDLEQIANINLYDVLGISRATFTKTLLKKAHRSKALRLHPDKNLDATPEQLRENEQKFLALQNAYAILSDDNLREKYNDLFDAAEQETKNSTSDYAIRSRADRRDIHIERYTEEQLKNFIEMKNNELCSDPTIGTSNMSEKEISTKYSEICSSRETLDSELKQRQKAQAELVAKTLETKYQELLDEDLSEEDIERKIADEKNRVVNEMFEKSCTDIDQSTKIVKRSLLTQPHIFQTFDTACPETGAIAMYNPDGSGANYSSMVSSTGPGLSAMFECTKSEEFVESELTMEERIAQYHARTEELAKINKKSI